MTDQPQSVIYCLSMILKFCIGQTFSFQDIAILVFCRFGLKLPSNADFGGIFPQITKHKKSYKTTIFHLSGEKPQWNDLKLNLYTRRSSNVITCSKFKSGILRGYDSTEGRIFHFPIDF